MIIRTKTEVFECQLLSVDIDEKIVYAVTSVNGQSFRKDIHMAENRAQALRFISAAFEQINKSGCLDAVKLSSKFEGDVSYTALAEEKD